MFLSVLRFSLVCNTFMPLWFLENVSTNDELIFNGFTKISGHVWDKLLFNCFCGVYLSFEMLLLLEGEGLIMVRSVDCLIVELLQKDSSPWHVFLLAIIFCFVSSAITVSIRFLSVFEASDFIIWSYISSMSRRLFFSLISSVAARIFESSLVFPRQCWYICKYFQVYFRDNGCM